MAKRRTKGKKTPTKKTPTKKAPMSNADAIERSRRRLIRETSRPIPEPRRAKSGGTACARYVEQEGLVPRPFMGFGTGDEDVLSEEATLYVAEAITKGGF